MKVRLTNYAWLVCSTSAGKDSSCMLDVLVEDCLAQGVPLDRLVAAHADLVGIADGARLNTAHITQLDGGRAEFVLGRTTAGGHEVVPAVPRRVAEVLA